MPQRQVLEHEIAAGADRCEECCDKQTEVEHRRASRGSPLSQDRAAPIRFCRPTGSPLWRSHLESLGAGAASHLRLAIGPRGPVCATTSCWQPCRVTPSVGGQRSAKSLLRSSLDRSRSSSASPRRRALQPRATAPGARTVGSGRPAATVTAPERGPSRGSTDPGRAASRVRASRRVTFGRTTFSGSTGRGNQAVRAVRPGVLVRQCSPGDRAPAPRP